MKKQPSAISQVKRSLAGLPAAFEVHEHSRLNEPREWMRKIVHSHEGGSKPHRHPGTGPSFYGYGWAHGKTNKVTPKPTGEQLELIAISDEDNSFELVITDSAMINTTTPIGNTPVEALGFPAAQRMVGGHRMKCVVRDERKGRA